MFKKKIFSFVSVYLVLTCYFGLLKSFAVENLKLDIVYPKDKSSINAESTFFIGSTEPTAELKINGKNVKVYANGSFVKVIGLKQGLNKIEIKSTLNNTEKTLTYTLKTPLKSEPLPHEPLKILAESITPSGELIYQNGDIINVEFKGSMGYKATFSIDGTHDIPMKELSHNLKGTYKGSYIFSEEDKFEGDVLSVNLTSKDSKLTEFSKAKISLMPKNRFISLEVINDNATARNAPYAYGKRLTPLAKGTLLTATGKINDYYRFKMADTTQAWLKASDIKLLPCQANEPFSQIEKIDTTDCIDNVEISIPLTAKLPVSLAESNGNNLILDIYGATTALTDAATPNNPFIKLIQVSQPYNKVVRLETTLNSKQLWGYSYSYCGNNLILKLRKAPEIDVLSPLKDKIIAIDPGHGGGEFGSVGPTRIPEKTVNMAIANYLKQELEQCGAKVILTRTNDDENPGLYERSEIARKNNALILLSIHNNALPDGQDPFKKHGASVYYYNPQALQLAKSIQSSLIKNLKLKSDGVFFGSLALTRPTDPLSVLVEVAYMINPDEYAKLITPEFQKQSAIAIKKGLIDFFANNADCEKK